jgi:hypothetical protein
VPSRKQRRRRLKERRHEYEYVYVDDEGHEVEVDEAEQAAPRPGGRNGSAKASTARTARGKPIQPPSWARAARKSLLFGPVLILLVYLTSKKHDLATILPSAIVFMLVLLPVNYMTESMLYRSYLKRTGKAPPARGDRAKEPKA